MDRARSVYGGPIVISGVAGRFPKCADMTELENNLLDGSDMTTTTEKRWTLGVVPERMGFLDCLDKFDASFFNLTPRQAEQLDPATRILMEASVEAILDAGYSPSELRGSNTGVFCGSTGGEALDSGYLKWNPDATGYVALSSSTYVTPARIAFALDLHGSSAHVSSACSSGLAAVEMAVNNILLGNIDAAIVTGSNIILNPRTHLEFTATRTLAVDSRCKPFDESADGFVRAELAVAILIQKQEHARRSYGRILNVRSNTDGWKHAGLNYPSGNRQEDLLRETYDQVGIDRNQVSYVEAHGTGTPAGDPEELGAISGFFCRGMHRKKYLLIGSVKSNMGHGESGASMAGLAKAIVTIHTGLIPRNLNFKTPRSELKDLMDEGKVEVVTGNTPFDGGLIGINAFGIGGTNSHLILQPGQIRHHLEVPQMLHLPTLVPISGRTKEKLRESLEDACEHAKNPEYLYLLQSAYGKRVPGLPYRAFALLNPADSSATSSGFERISVYTQPPLWIVFTGVGTQWAGMGMELMGVEPFSESIRGSRLTIKNITALDLDDLLASHNSSIFHNIHHALIAVTAIQMALWDTLKQVLPSPNGFIGHSYGEMLVAYADGCYTAEETWLMTHAAGLALKNGRKVDGAMASIGMTAEEIQMRLPMDVQLGCINSPQNVTVSGKKTAVNNFVEQLKSEGKLAFMINSCNVASHSWLVEEAGELFMRYSDGVLTSDARDRLKRSSRWVSTIVPTDASLDEKQSQSWQVFATAEYMKRCMQMPVLFHEATKQVPAGSVVIELSPKGSFQSVLKESLAQGCISITPLTFKGNDKLSYFYESVGRMYVTGLDTNMTTLYPQVSLPVSANTPFISPLVNWDHSQCWKTHVIHFPLESGYEVEIDLNSSTHALIQGHKINGAFVYPASGYIFHVWAHFADVLGKELNTIPVTLLNVRFQRATVLSKKGEPTRLLCVLLAGSGKFEIKHDGEAIVTGTIKLQEKDGASQSANPYTSALSPDITEPALTSAPNCIPLDASDIYKELRLRGICYSGDFRGINKIDNEGKWADVLWKGNWIAFLDALLQTWFLVSLDRNLTLPSEIERIEIDPVEFLCNVTQNMNIVRVLVDHIKGTISCRGVLVQSVASTTVPHSRQTYPGKLAYEKHTFCAHFGHATGSDLDESIREGFVWGMTDLALENSATRQLQVADVFTKSRESAAPIFAKIIALNPRYQCNLEMVTLPEETEKLSINHKLLGTVSTKGKLKDLVPDVQADLIFLDDQNLLNVVAKRLKPSGFLLLHKREIKQGMPEASRHLSNLALVSQKTSKEFTVSLYRHVTPEYRRITHFQITQAYLSDFDWVSELQKVIRRITMETGAHRIYFTSQGEPLSGILGFVKCFLEENNLRGHIRCIFDPETKLAMNFKNPCPMLQSIIENDLVLNVLRNGELGSYRHLQLDASQAMVDAKNAYLSMSTPGDLTCLNWIQTTLEPCYPFQEAHHSQRYDIAYSGINFHDVLQSMGNIPVPPYLPFDGPNLGAEFSGWDMEGNCVMGIGTGGMLATLGWADKNFVWPVPKHWTLEEAATVPFVYSTVMHALHTKGRIQGGQSVLIHSGSGGIGYAAILVALAHGCEVFTTVGSPEKKDFIKREFPVIKDDNIGNSRDTSFKDQFLQVTRGRGIDIVLNSLEGEKLKAGLSCVAADGKFLHIGVHDVLKNTALGMRPFLKNIEFIGAGIQLIRTQGREYGGKLWQMIKDGVAAGVVKPLPRHVYRQDQVEDAFRLMAHGKHIGKVLIKFRDDFGTTTKISAFPRVYFSRDRTYIVVGGLGGMGLEVSNWLIERGARNIILPSRSGIRNGYQSLCMRKWSSVYAANIATPPVDLSNVEEAESFFRHLCTSSAFPAVGGIFNCAMVLYDDDFNSQTKETFAQVAAPKAVLTNNLDYFSRLYCPNLDYFVAFSSTASGRGCGEQTNYGWANSAMERICEQRWADGLHGLALQWGYIGQVGYSAEKAISVGMESSEGYGMLPLPIKSCLQVLERALQQQEQPLVCCFLAAPRDKCYPKQISTSLTSMVEKIFGIEHMDTLSPETKLRDLGLDSLSSFTLMQVLARDFNLSLTREALRKLDLQDLKAIDAGSYSK